jgi:peptidoglycan/xylan/chitin deacetylase (PgdA/CDA1 family)
MTLAVIIMTTIKLSLGFDVERPHSQFALSKMANKVRLKQIAYIQNISKELDKKNIPRTFFILGNYLERCLDDFSTEILRDVYNKNNSLNEIQQHTYSHLMIRKIKERTEKKIATLIEFRKDIRKANNLLKNILDITPFGLRLPFGYYHDLTDVPDFLTEIQKLGIIYVSSDLRAKNSLEAPLTIKRQPHTYKNAKFPDIIEIPSHGWQDAIFTEEMSSKYLGARLKFNSTEIFSHYDELLEKALKFSIEKSPFYISLCLHPWAMMEYDPKLLILSKIISSAKSKGILIDSYGAIAKEVLNK